MKKYFALFFLLLIFFNCNAAEIKYSAFSIPDTLKQNAWAVVRNQQTIFEIISLTKTRTEIIKVVTILNKNGKKLGWENFSYDNDKKIIKVNVKLYNALGVEVDNWDRGDLKDVSYDPYGTTYTDTRILSAKPISNNYPYTVAYSLVFEQNNTYNMRYWIPVWSDNLSIEKSTYKVIYPEGFKLNFNEKNHDSFVLKSTEQNKIEWTLTNFPALKDEPYSTNPEEYLPYLSVVPVNFTYDKNNGSFNSWRELGFFYNNLNSGRAILTENKKQEISKIVDTCTSDELKVKYLYEYMQSHTRYISIQVGIGGLQPISAYEVAKTGYGDCKALSNYMMAILQHADIKSYFTLIKAGSFNYYFDPNFVSHQFNHAILCVPLKNDTIWLECTSQTMPYGFLGDFTDNRFALLITENGGVLVKTPTYSKSQNRIDRIGLVKVGEDGNCDASLVSEFTGLEYNNMHHISIEDKEDQLKMLYENYDIPNFKIRSFKLNTQDNKNPVLKETLELDLISYASQSGSRIFLPLNLASKSTSVPTETIDRKLDINKKYTASYSDTITYNLPKDYTVEVIPHVPTIDNKYGKYTVEIIENENSLIYIRNYEINKGVYPSEAYDAFRNFFKEVRESDGAMVVLKRN